MFSFIVRLLKDFHNEIDFNVMKLEKRDFMFLNGKRDDAKAYFNKKIGFYVQLQIESRIQQIKTLNEIIELCSKDIIDAIKRIKEYSCNGLKLDFDKILIVKEIDESKLINLKCPLGEIDDYYGIK